MTAITAETYTTANGSNMDAIAYDGSASIYEIAADLRSGYDNWDYAILTDDDGEEIATIEREQAIEISDPVSGSNVTVTVDAHADIDDGTFFYVSYAARASAEVDCRFAVIEHDDNMVCQSDWQEMSATPDTVADYRWVDCTPNDEPEYYSATEAAEILGVSRMRVNQLIHDGQLDARKVGNAWQVYRRSVENRMRGE